MPTTRKQRFAAFMVVAVVLSLLAATPAIAGRFANPKPAERTHDTFRKQTARAFHNAARIAGGSVRTTEIAIGSREDGFLAATPLHGVEGIEALAYISFAESECAQTLPPGFYTIDFVTLSTGEREAIFRTLAGEEAVALPAQASSLPPTAPPAVVSTSSPVGQDTPCIDLGEDGVTYFDLINMTCRPGPNE